MNSAPETSRLGLPKQRINSISLRDLPQAKVITSRKTPIPSLNYNSVFCRPLLTETKRAGKLTGYGRISTRRNMSMFKNDSVVMPM